MLEKLNFIGPEARPYVTVGRGEHRLDPRFVAGVRVLTCNAALVVRSLHWFPGHSLSPERPD